MRTSIRAVLITALAGLAACYARAATPTLTGADVGTPSMTGETTVAADGKITVVGGGADIWGTVDAFHYAYFKVTGDFDYVMKVDSLVGNSGDGGWSKVELMARQEDPASPGAGPQAGDPHISNMTTRSSGDTANSAPAGVNHRGPQWRAIRDNNSSWTTPTTAYPPNIPNNWMRMERVGSTFYMYTSNDGTTWNMYGPYDPQGWDTSGSWPPGTDNPDVAFFSEAWPSTIFLGIAVTAHNDADVTTAVISNFGPYTPKPIAITTQPPATLSVSQNNALELKVAATGDPVHYEWRKDGTPIARAVGPTYKVNLAQPSDAGTYTVRVFGGGTEIVSSASVVTVTVDTQPPTVAGISPDVSFTALRVEYSEPVADSALTAANYKIDQGITVSSVARVNPTTVQLTTSKMGEGADYNLTINGVKDTANPANTIATDTKVAFKSVVFELGYATYERWDNANGDPGAIADFATAILEGTIRPPDISTSVPQFGAPWGVADNYASKVSGYFVPPSNGDYVFFLASDDQSNLYLSTDDQPANKKLIVQESGWSNQYQWQTIGGGSNIDDKRSDTFFGSEWPNPNVITLQAGKRYYIEILHDEGGGGDGADATFIKAGDTDPAQSAAGMFLNGAAIGSYLNPNGASVEFVTQPVNTTSDVDRAATFTANATGTSLYTDMVTYQWQKAASGSSTFADIVGATGASYTTPTLKIADNGTKFRVIARVPTVSATSAEVTLTVVQDITPPQVAGVGAIASQTGSTYDVAVTFDEKVEAASAGNMANYKLSGGTISAIKFYEGSPGVVLTVSGLTAGSSYTVTVSNVVDLFGNKLSSAEGEFTISPMKWGVVGGSEVGTGNAVLAVGENGFDIYSDGIAEWGTYDEATFVYEEVTGDFDKKLRIEYQDASSQWARAGLIARDVTNFGVDRGAQEAGEAGRYQKVHVNPVGPTLTGPGTGGNAAWEGNRRLAAGAATTSAGGSTGVVPQYPNAWVRMQRKGDLFTIFRSDDGVNWTQLGTTTFDEPMPAKLYVGPEFSPENGNITEEASRGTFVAKMRDYGDTYPPLSVGLNFGSTQAGGSLTATDVAGVPGVAQPLWNNLPDLSGSVAKVVVNANGVSQEAPIAVEWASNNLWSSTGAGEENNAFTGSDKILMTGYLDTEAATTTSVTIKGIPGDVAAAGYDVYVYTLGGVAGGRSGGYRVLDATSKAVLKDYVFGTSLTNPGAYQETPISTDKANPAAGTHIVFRNLTATGIIVEATTANGLGGSGTPRAPINAIQLVTPATEEVGPPPTASASIVRTASGATITYTGTLESADSVLGPWTAVAGATSPYAVTTTGGAKFYRVK